LLNKSCRTCYFSESCPQHSPCKDYYPIDDDAIDREIEALSEKKYRSFYEEWLEYITQFYD
jgi:hypothetical protein